MKSRDSNETFLDRCFKAADAAKMGDRKKCAEFMVYFKERIKAVTADQIKAHFILKNLEEAITWYRILIYSGYNNYERDPRIKAMFSIIVRYIAENAPSEQKRKLMAEFMREGFH
ncbi:MAG: hypothetical protein JSU83_11055 [Deltaproteobacteria bacterium]|nr:MAG: hypothetical protein JSU83_11055 [Deltaproteobacteria bacterium]